MAANRARVRNGNAAVLAGDELESRLVTDGKVVWPVSVGSVKDNAQIAHSSDDGWIERELIPKATAFVERLGQVALITQTRVVAFDYAFPTVIETRWPLQTAESVVYVDGDYDEVTINEDDYRVLTIGKPGRINAKRSTPWPTPTEDLQVVRVNYTAGFGDTEASVPPEWKTPVIMLATYWWEHREHFTAEFVNQAFYDVLKTLIDAAGKLVRYG